MHTKWGQATLFQGQVHGKKLENPSGMMEQIRAHLDIMSANDPKRTFK